MIEHVIKRNGRKQLFKIEQLEKRIEIPCKKYGLDPNILLSKITNLNLEFISTSDLDKLLIQEAIRLTELDTQDFSKLNWRFVAANVKLFSIYRTTAVGEGYYKYLSKMVSLKLYDEYILNAYSANELTNFYKEHLDLMPKLLDFDYSGINLLAERYLIKLDGVIIEDPFFLFLTLSLIIASKELTDKLEFASKLLNSLLDRKISLATPILNNLRKTNGNLSSCFIGSMDDDLDSIFSTIHDMAKVSKNGGGTAVNVSHIRASGSSLRGTKNAAKGVLPWVKIFDDMLMACDQAGCVSSNSYVSIRAGWSISRTTSVHDFGKVEADRPSHQEMILASEVKIGDYIKSFNIETGQNEFNKVLNIMHPVVKKENQIKIVSESGCAAITSDWHPILHKKDDSWDYKRTDELNQADDIIKTSKNPEEKIKEIFYDDQADEQFIDFEVENVNNYYSGLVPNKMIVLHNSRTGAGTVAIDSWHLDIIPFLEMQKENGDLAKKAFRIQPQIAVSDLFMQRVEDNESWTLFDPHEILIDFDINLPVLYGDEFKVAYELIEKEANKGIIRLFKKVQARELFKTILKTLVETGKPYIFFKDTVNNLNPNKHLGYIPNANLCTESFSNVTFSKVDNEYFVTDNHYAPHPKNQMHKQVTKVGETHTCDLVSPVLSNIIDDEDLELNIRMSVRILDNLIDLGNSPVKEAEVHHEKYRILGIGMLGLADYLVKKKLTYARAEDEVSKLAEKIAYFALSESMHVAIDKEPYKAFDGSDFSKGIVFGKDAKWFEDNEDKYSLDKQSWLLLLDGIKQFGVRNGSILAIAPNCQDPNNPVQTIEGIKSIYQILEEQLLLEKAKILENNNTPEWIVLNKNISVPTYEGEDLCERIWYNGIQETIDITFEDGITYSYTPNHKLLVNRDNSELWVRCDELLEGDDVISI